MLFSSSKIMIKKTLLLKEKSISNNEKTSIASMGTLKKKIGRFDSIAKFCSCLQNVSFAFVK